MSEKRITSLPRFLCRDLAMQLRLGKGGEAGKVVLSEAESHHAMKVLRLKVGAGLVVFDGQGIAVQGELIELERRAATVQVLGTPAEWKSKERDSLQLTVASAVPKGSRAGDMVNQLTQVGVDTWLPMETARSVVQPREAKQDRLERQAIEAAKQSGRLWLMEVERMTGFVEVLQREAGLKLIMDLPVEKDEAGDESGFDGVLTGVESVLLLVGPEGGWTAEERAQAAAAGFRSWSINPNVLRIETAAVAAAALVRYLA